MKDRDDMLHAIAEKTNAARPGWGTRGILAAAKRVQEDIPLEWIEAAFIYGAKTRRDQRSPWFLAEWGDHWEKTKPRTPQQTLNRGPLCAVCQRTKEVHDRCESLVAPKDRHDFETEPDRQARIRAEHVQRTSGRPDSIPDLLSGLGGWPS